MARREEIHIDQLRIAVPGLTAAEARRLGREVADRIAEGGAKLRPQRLGRLDLRIQTPPGATHESLAAIIAGRILESLAE